LGKSHKSGHPLLISDFLGENILHFANENSTVYFYRCLLSDWGSSHLFLLSGRFFLSRIVIKFSQ
jgi:hypothetical protein